MVYLHFFFNDGLSGDHLYDYAKIYQSILGLDYILEFEEQIPQHIFKKIDYLFWSYLIGQQIISLENKNNIALEGYFT